MSKNDPLAISNFVSQYLHHHHHHHTHHYHHPSIQQDIAQGVGTIVNTGIVYENHHFTILARLTKLPWAVVDLLAMPS